MVKYRVIGSTAKTDFPVRQGDLDFLCPVYAAINALHLIGDISEVDQAAIQFRLAIMFMQAAKDWDLARSLTEGIDPADMTDLLSRLAWRDISGLAKHEEQLNARSLAERLAATDGLKRSAVISLVDTKNRELVHHYVAADAADATIRLHDSQFPSQILVDRAKIHYGAERTQVSVGHAWIFTQRANPEADIKNRLSCVDSR
jgi:hypothetical protein